MPCHNICQCYCYALYLSAILFHFIHRCKSFVLPWSPPEHAWLHDQTRSTAELCSNTQSLLCWLIKLIERVSVIWCQIFFFDFIGFLINTKSTKTAIITVKWIVYDCRASSTEITITNSKWLHVSSHVTHHPQSPTHWLRYHAGWQHSVFAAGTLLPVALSNCSDASPQFMKQFTSTIAKSADRFNTNGDEPIWVC